MPQGLALMESVELHSSTPIMWSVLALDDGAFDYLCGLKRANLEVIHIDNFEDKDLQLVKNDRPWKEFCWTSAACILNYSLALDESADFVAYIDADCFFFGDIAEMFGELPREKNIGVHEHRFSRDREDWLYKSGRFNVGVVLGRKSEEFKQCAARWRTQVIERCDVNQSEGRCGDQTYLNEWPSLYVGLQILEGQGVGLAPWNAFGLNLYIKENKVLVESDPLYFYHFHGLEVGISNRFITLFVSAAGYKKLSGTYKLIYAPYVSTLVRLSRVCKKSISRKRGARWYIRNGAHRNIHFILK